jgi:hypothetical protein
MRIAVGIWGVLCGAVTLSAAPPNHVTITDLTGRPQTNRPVTISRVFVKGDIPHYAQAVIGGVNIATQCDVKTRWPDQSVKHALISFVVDLPPKKPVIVAFSDQPDGNQTGGLDRAAMLARSWDGQIELTQGTTLAASARRILNDWDGSPKDSRVKYWLQGPICTQVILEDRTPRLSYDLGWDGYKGLHPIFVATFYPGSSVGVKVEMILENMWSTKLEDQTYSLVLRTTGPSAEPAYSRSGYVHAAMSRWRKTFWSGKAPGAINVDFNVPYMTYSQALPNFDLSKMVPEQALQADHNSFLASDRGDLGGHADWTLYMPQTGGRPDLGLMPAWYGRWLFSSKAELFEEMLSRSEVSGYVPHHLRESATDRFYDSAHKTSAFGRNISLDARPSFYLPKLDFEETLPGDRLTPVGSMRGNGWTPDLAHYPAMVYVPYLVTGDWYLLEELYLVAGAHLASAVNGTNHYSRHDSWGWLNSEDVQTRGQAWGLRDIAEAAYLAPDGTPEKAYFTEKLLNNLAVEEGFQNETGGPFAPSDPTCRAFSEKSNDKWCWGRKVAARGWLNPLHFTSVGFDYDSFPNDPAFVGAEDPNAPMLADRLYQVAYKFVVMGHIRELGFPASGACAMFKFGINLLANPAFNPWLVEAYTVPTAGKANRMFYQDWPTLLAAFRPNIRSTRRFPDPASDDNNVIDPGYPHLWKAAAAYFVGMQDGHIAGADAWHWLSTNVRQQGRMVWNPQYALLPRTAGASGSIP